MNKSEETYLVSRDRGYMATFDALQRPTIVPVCFVYSNGRVYTMVDSKPKKARILGREKNIASNESVALLVDTYSDDWRRLSYLLIRGRAKLLQEGKEAEEARRLLVAKYPQYRWLGTGPGRVIRVEVESSTLWKFS